MARAIWTGSISFGLVTIPVKVFSAIREHDVHFHQVTKDGTRVRLERVSEKTGRRVDFADIKKGYQAGKGKVVVIEPDELGALAPHTTRTIDIEDFVALDDIDPVYYQRTYHLAPQDTAAARAYALLADVMSRTSRVGIGKVVMRDKQYLAAIRPYGKGLAMSTMLFADEVVPQSDIDDIPSRKRTIATRERHMAEQIVDSLATSWDPRRYHDDYQDQLQKFVKAKAKGKDVEAPPAPEPAAVLDLVEALQASLDRPKHNGARRSTRKASATKPKRRTA